ncbi:hypothetical protein NDU88_004726 [Pleurodeles waltl]|uniref:Uncharacterized protein n=1 Tax=Pleurodeles waltl TaxID=8319 RepID=A0AAV7M7W7_PLEWA|nr:hypothetical protein NDU88_004726 [Pleurodeles waltl]
MASLKFSEFERFIAGEDCLRKLRRYSSLGHSREGTIARQADLAQSYNVTLSAQRCEEEVRPRQRGVALQLKQH